MTRFRFLPKSNEPVKELGWRLHGFWQRSGGDVRREKPGTAPPTRYSRRTLIRRQNGVGLANEPARPSQWAAFEVVACDDLYERSAEFRRRMAENKLYYAAQVPAGTQVYPAKPEVKLPEPLPHGAGLNISNRRPARHNTFSAAPTPLNFLFAQRDSLGFGIRPCQDGYIE